MTETNYVDKNGNPHFFDFIARKGSDSLDLRGMIFCPGHFPKANFSGCDLRGSDLGNTHLLGADFRNADLRGAKFHHTDLEGADFRGCKLDGVNFFYGYLIEANFEGCDLRKVNFEGSILRGMKIEDAKLPKFQVPQNQDLIVWKMLSGGKIAQLRIPKEAKRTGCLRSKKCRAEYAVVLAIFQRTYRQDRTVWTKAESGLSQHDYTTTYKVGEKVVPDGYNDEPQEECVNGIHFFMSRLDAENY
jgi:hypothetical protein